MRQLLVPGVVSSRCSANEAPRRRRRRATASTSLHLHMLMLLRPSCPHQLLMRVNAVAGVRGQLRSAVLIRVCGWNVVPCLICKPSPSQACCTHIHVRTVLWPTAPAHTRKRERKRRMGSFVGCRPEAEAAHISLGERRGARLERPYAAAQRAVARTSSSLPNRGRVGWRTLPMGACVARTQPTSRTAIHRAWQVGPQPSQHPGLPHACLAT